MVWSSVVPVIDMSMTGMIPLTLRHDLRHLFNQRALQDREKMGYGGPRPWCAYGLETISTTRRNGRGPDTSLKRLSIFAWTRVYALNL